MGEGDIGPEGPENRNHPAVVTLGLDSGGPVVTHIADLRTLCRRGRSRALGLQSGGRVQAQSRNPLLNARDGPAPAWHNQSWLNADHPIELEELRGRVVLLNFWVFTCYNCTNTVPSLVAFDHRYRDQGLTIIGIHTPEFPPYAGEHDKGNLQRALGEVRHRVPQRPGQRQRDLEPVWNQVLAQLRAHRQEGSRPLRRVPASSISTMPTTGQWDGRIRELLAEPYAVLHLETAPAGADTRVTLLAAPGLKINARLKPALELAGGTVVRFDSPHLTPDSAYYTAPPVALLAGHGPITGVLRASVCGVHEQVCRMVAISY